MTNDELLTRVVGLLQRCQGWEGSEVANARARAWDYYFQRPRGDEVEGRSPTVSGDVSSMVEAVLASMTDAFDTDGLVEFCAYDEADQDQARLESEAVSQLLMERNGWYQLTSAVKEALLLRNAVAKVRVTRRTRRTITHLDNVTPVGLAALEDMAGVELVASSGTKATVATRRTLQRLEMSCVHLENFLYVEWPLEDFENIPCVAERHVSTRQSLIDDEGFDATLVNKLIADHQPYKSDAVAHDVARHIPALAAIDAEQELITWFEVYPLIDGERRRVCFSQNTLLENELFDDHRPPYAVGCVFINPGKLTGISLYDKERTTQDVTTGLQRALLDAVNALVMNRIAVLEGAVSGDQLTDNDPSGVLQVKAGPTRGDIRNGVLPIQIPDITPGLLANLAYQRQVRAEMGGAALDISTAQVQLPERVGSMGLDRAYSATEQLAALALKTLSQTFIRELWLLAHSVLRRHWDGPINIRVDGRWQETFPARWRPRDHAIVRPGMSPGERRRRSDALAMIIQQQEKLAALGMEDVLVDAERYYRALCDWAHLNDIKMPERYLIDPTTEQARAALASKAEERMKQSMAAQQLQQHGIALEHMSRLIEKYGIDVRAAVDYYKANLAAEEKEAELTVGLVKEREKAAQAASAAIETPSEPSANAGESD